jgi:diguanylate cyclase (GGDEF)-like protein
MMKSSLDLEKNAVILVVDDLRENLYFLQELLELEEYQVLCASHGQEALLIIEENNPDLILLDLMMPKISGIEVCEKLKSNPKFQEIPIIFLTASHESEHLIQAFKAGAADYITKPFNLPELFARVRTHLELKLTRDQLKTALEEQKKLSQKLEKLATIDSLTEIPNRRYFLDLANKELQRTQRYGQEFSLLMLDLDYFKNVNDTYGHAAGDEVLIQMTKTTTNCLRNVDIFGRLGGEEFAILLPQTCKQQAEYVAERIRKNVAETSVETPDALITITLSIGITIYQKEDQKIEDILKRADQALYEAKAQGRNRVISTVSP